LVESFIKDKESNLIGSLDNLNKQQKDIRFKTHQTLNKITDNMEHRYLFNTVIAALMKLSNTLSKFNSTADTSMAVRKESLYILLKTLSPIAPHLCHHLWQELGNTRAVINEPWPSVDKTALAQDKMQIIVQVNGKLRAKLMMSADTDKTEVEEKALTDNNIMKFTQGKTVDKVITVLNKLVNIVVK
jgi:leucyl-tRNA synthetase